MSATVIDLASRRAQPRTRETCRTCRRGTDGSILECYPHRLDSLADRVRYDLLSTQGELLIDRETLADRLTDVLHVLETITDECLRPDERGTR
ncbi:hypothetical protein [Nocardioides sp. cx-173]|uniref:hypothetical protein n=1 Tax=Nocardioides sp. cx-173 TaxID=2898796 RepID=UPI001E629D89|nr:hypothetical protein [Nocardioides sp. cx-173]MCD4525233.1 hypothetical protein [Nocardioides sp. cx-173]UGB40964.1 hypothetical protein LQ940_16500 [Nocardioides sp. cx-173]